ncbi:MAG: hypothetical protein WA417_15980, partial [Stellaceae bacterium]
MRFARLERVLDRSRRIARHDLDRFRRRMTDLEPRTWSVLATAAPPSATPPAAAPQPGIFVFLADIGLGAGRPLCDLLR